MEIDIDKKTIKALSTDSRLNILKSLAKRRKMPAELAKVLGLAPSTITEHLRRLEEAGLVARKETGHKWIYYELTNKGSNLVQPSQPIRFVLTLLVGAGLAFLGAIELLTSRAYMMATGPAAEAIVPKAPAYEVAVWPLDWFFIAALVIGLILIVISVVKLKK